MKAILVSPSEKEFLVNAGDRLPLGVSYVSIALTANGISNRIIDLNHTTEEEAVEQIRKNLPDVIGLSIPSSPTYGQMKNFAGRVSGLTKKIVAGGNHITFRPFMTYADALVIGEGEGAIDAFKSERGIFKGTFDINQHPIPDRTKLPSDRYNMQIEGRRATGMVSSRGCPFSCGFCGISRHKVLFRNLDNIVEELSIIKSQDYQAVYFYDDNFMVKKDHAVNVTDACKRAGLEYRVEARADLIDKDMALQLKNTGCLLVAMGIESHDPKVLNTIGKRESPEQIREAVYTLGAIGVKTKGYFMFGLPYQTIESAIGTIEFAKDLKQKGLTYADFYIFTPYPGSQMGEHLQQYGMVKLIDNYAKLAHASTKLQSTVSTQWMNKSQIEYITKEAQRQWSS